MIHLFIRKQNGASKRDYLHYNPVEAGFVTKPEEWKYSAAHKPRLHICASEEEIKPFPVSGQAKTTPKTKTS